jgi:glyoxalase/bleomycin resistance protein/dioxygenase superfamily protein
VNSRRGFDAGILTDIHTFDAAMTDPDAPRPINAEGHRFVQIAYFVADVRVAAMAWAQRFGAGPFFVAEHIALTSVVVRGLLSQLDHTSAYGWHGDLMVELVQQNCRTPSIFSDRAYGLHHMAYFAADIDAELARLDRLGIGTAMTAMTASGVRFAFADANTAMGHYLELYHDDAAIRGFYEFVRRASVGWHGSEPVRML